VIQIALTPVFNTVTPRVLGDYRGWCTKRHLDFGMPDSLERYFKANDADLLVHMSVALSADFEDVTDESVIILNRRGVLVSTFPDKYLLSASLALFKSFILEVDSDLSRKIRKTFLSAGFQNVLHV